MHVIAGETKPADADWNAEDRERCSLHVAAHAHGYPHHKLHSAPCQQRDDHHSRPGVILVMDTSDVQLLPSEKELKQKEKAKREAAIRRAKEAKSADRLIEDRIASMREAKVCPEVGGADAL